MDALWPFVCGDLLFRTVPEGVDKGVWTERASERARKRKKESQRNAPLQKRKRRRMLNDPSTSGQPSATLFSSCFSALYGLADRAAWCPSLMRTSRKMAARHCPRPFLVRHFEILYRPYRRWLPTSCVYYIIYTRTDDDKRHRVDENTPGRYRPAAAEFCLWRIFSRSPVSETWLSAFYFLLWHGRWKSERV